MSKSKGQQAQNQSQSSQSSSQSVSNPNVPSSWTDLLNQIQGSAGANGQGATAGAAGNYFTNQLNGTTAGYQPGTSNLSSLISNSSGSGLNDLLNNYANNPDFTLASLAASGNPAYAAVTPTGAPTVTAGQVSGVPAVGAPTAASYMGAYTNPYNSQVLGAALNQQSLATGQAQNALNAKYGGSSAFGSTGERQGVEQAELANEAGLTQGTLASNLLSQGFNTAAGLGATDAGSQLQALLGNQSTALSGATTNANLNSQASTANAANSLAAQQFNNSLINNQQQFNVNSAITQNQNKVGTINDMVNNLATGNSGMGANATGAAGVGSTGLSTLLSLLGIGTQQFGSTTNTTGQSSGTSSGSGSAKGKGANSGNFLQTLLNAATA